MGMVIRTNFPSLFAGRNLKNNQKKSGSALEKLASGYKINRAADDASGLAVSEKMRAQITALNTISDGCKDGVNLIHTIDGYLNEVQDMIVRMEELAMKSADGILEDFDRECLQCEMDNLGAEIDRIADTANFNGNTILTANRIKQEHGTIYPAVGSQYLGGIAEDDLLDIGDKPEGMDEAIFMAKRYDATLKFASDSVQKYLSDIKNIPNYNPAIRDALLDGKAMYYTLDGNNCIIGGQTLSDNAIRSQLGIGNSEKYGSIVMHGEYSSWNAGIDRHNLIDGDTFDYLDSSFGEETMSLLVKTANKYLSNSGRTLRDLENKSFYYTKDGKTCIIASDNPGLEKSSYYETRISLVKHSEMYYKIDGEAMGIKGAPWTWYDYDDEPEPIFNTLQIGETSGRPDKLNVRINDFHTGTLFNPIDFDYVKIPNIGVGGSSIGNYAWGEGYITGDYELITFYPPLKEYRRRTDEEIERGEGRKFVPDISTQENAIRNIDYIKGVNNQVSLARSYYGALENRLEYIINNHENTIENISAARSRIKDADMAEEMMKYTRENILTQAAQTMIAQANMRPQNILQLLQ